MPVILQKVATITPTNQALELRLEKNGSNVVLTAIFDAESKTTATVPWKVLWTATFLKDSAAKRADAKMHRASKHIKQGKTPSTLDLLFSQVNGHEVVSITTGDLRQALLAIK